MKSTLLALRVLFGIGLIALSLWALLLPPVFPYSSYAVVNAKLVAIKAGDPGKVGSLPNDATPQVKAGGPVAKVERDLLKIQRELEESQFTRTKIQEQAQSLNQLIESRERTLAEATLSAASTREAAMRASERSLNAAREKARITGETLLEKRTGEAKVAVLLKDGIITSAQWSETRQETLEAEKMAAAVQLELGEEEAKLNALREGPGGQIALEIETATGKIDSLNAEIGKLKVQRLDLQSELVAVENKIAAVKANKESDTSYSLTSPIEGVIWRRHVVNGENLREGQVVADVADANHIYIEAFFRQEFMNSIAVGDKTTIKLIPGTHVLTGRVVDIQVQDSSSKSPSIINTSPIGAWMLRVIIEADSNQLGTDKVGKMAKVLISKPDANLAEKALLGLTTILRGHE